MTFSGSERIKLAAALIDAGPDAPTACAGWTTHDLAVHLKVRETRPDAAAGMFIPPLKKHLESVTEQVKAENYRTMVEAWALGPGRKSPMRLFDRWVNAAEHFVHHEDVRRGSEPWEPREFSEAEERALYGLMKNLKVMVSRSKIPVVLQPTGFRRVIAADKQGVAANGSDVIRVAGPVGEIVLWLYGRPTKGLVVEGDIDQLRRVKL